MKRTIKAVLLGKDGRLRTAWRLILGCIVCAVGFYGIWWGLTALCGVLFSAWGLTVSTLPYAPGWARWLVPASADIVYGASCLAGCVCAWAVVRQWGRGVPWNRRTVAAGAVCGLVLAAFVTLTALLADSMRLEWPLNEPALSWTELGKCVLLLLGAAFHETLTRRVVLDNLRERFGNGWGIAATCAFSLILAGAWTSVPGMVNAVMISWIGCRLYLRGGLGASSALRAGWLAWTTALFAFPSASGDSAYRLYHVSEGLLTGGNAGAERGLLCTIGCAVILMILYWQTILKVVKTRRARTKT